MTARQPGHSTSNSFCINTNNQVSQQIIQAPHEHAVCLQARSIKKGIHVCAVLCVVAVYSTKFKNAYLHPKQQQTPVWKVPQGGGVSFLNMYCYMFKHVL